jgi:hypothetical protein
VEGLCATNVRVPATVAGYLLHGRGRRNGMTKEIKREEEENDWRNWRKIMR